MTSVQSTITMPAARLEQLRKLADKRGVTISAIIESLISRAMIAGEIEDTTPGVPIVVRDRHVWIILGEKGLPPLNRTEASKLSNAIEEVLLTSKGVAAKLKDGFSIGISRKGTGIVMLVRDEVTDAASKVSMTPAIAADICRQIQIAALQC